MQITYNDILLSDCQTTTWNQEALYTDDGMEYIGTRFTVEVRAILNPYLSPAFIEINATQINNRIRSCLMKPRRQLIVTDDGSNTRLISPVADNATDARFGPKPLYCKITQIAGSLTFVVLFGIETTLYECCSTTPGVPGDDSVVPAYVSNRWREEHIIDEKFLTKRTINGKLYVRGNAGENADNFRDVVVPHIPNGFRRISSTYGVQEDGLAMIYAFVDQEEYRLPPSPAVKWEGERVASTNNGVTWTSEIGIKLWGHKATSKADLITLACRLALLGLKNTTVVKEPQKTIMVGAIRDTLHDNMVEVRLKVLNQLNTQTFFGFKDVHDFGVDFDQLFFGAKDVVASDPGTRGIAMLHMLDKVFNDPCLTQKLTTVSAVPANFSAGQGDNVEAQLIAVPVINNTPNQLRSVDDGVYTDYKITSWYYDDTSTLSLPPTGNTNLTAVAYTANSTRWKVVEWTATKVNAPPKLPSTNTDTNSILASKMVVPQAPQPTPDGGLIYRTSGRYTYNIIDPTNNDYVAGALPFVDMTVGDSTVQLTAFEDNILGGSNTLVAT